jgi:hypothetical protein
MKKTVQKSISRSNVGNVYKHGASQVKSDDRGGSVWLIFRTKDKRTGFVSFSPTTSVYLH